MSTNGWFARAHVTRLMAADAADSSDQGLKYILLIGFHHKLGPQVEYATPKFPNE